MKILSVMYVNQRESRGMKRRGKQPLFSISYVIWKSPWSSSVLPLLLVFYFCLSKLNLRQSHCRQNTRTDKKFSKHFQGGLSLTDVNCAHHEPRAPANLALLKIATSKNMGISTGPLLISGEVGLRVIQYKCCKHRRNILRENLTYDHRDVYVLRKTFAKDILLRCGPSPLVCNLVDNYKDNNLLNLIFQTFVQL